MIDYIDLENYLSGLSPADRVRYRLYNNLTAATDGQPAKLALDMGVDMASGAKVVSQYGKQSESQKTKALDRGNKYHAVAEYIDGVRYASKKEAGYARGLALRVQAGELRGFVPHVRFPLPGGTVHEVDFMLIWPYSGISYIPVTFIEVKGKDLPMGKLKRRQVEQLYGIRIEVA